MFAAASLPLHISTRLKIDSQTSGDERSLSSLCSTLLLRFAICLTSTKRSGADPSPCLPETLWVSRSVTLYPEDPFTCASTAPQDQCESGLRASIVGTNIHFSFRFVLGAEESEGEDVGRALLSRVRAGLRRHEVGAAPLQPVPPAAA